MLIEMTMSQLCMFVIPGWLVARRWSHVMKVPFQTRSPCIILEQRDHVSGVVFKNTLMSTLHWWAKTLTSRPGRSVDPLRDISIKYYHRILEQRKQRPLRTLPLVWKNEKENCAAFSPLLLVPCSVLVLEVSPMGWRPNQGSIWFWKSIYHKQQSVFGSTITKCCFFLLFFLYYFFKSQKRLLKADEPVRWWK